MRSVWRLALGVLALAAGSIAALAQSAVISARSGLIHYVEGQVYLGGQPVDTTEFGVFPEVKENQRLKTEEGRAEVLLTPGVFLRLGENSSFRMVTNRLIDTRLEFLSGSMVIEAENIAKDNSVTVVYKDATVHPARTGIYRFDATAGELRVYNGLAEVTAGDQTVEVREGHLIALKTLAVQKFDKTVNDALNRWSERRAGYVSMANVGAASALTSSSLWGSGLAGTFPGGWFWNPFFGMYSYVPGMYGMGMGMGGMGTGGMFYNPYGCPLFSPFDVSLAYLPSYYFFPCYNGYYPRYYYPNNAYTAYNGVNYKSVPPPKRPAGAGGVWSGGAGHGIASGSTGVLTPSGVSSGTSSSAGFARGGGVAGGSGGGVAGGSVGGGSVGGGGGSAGGASHH